MTAVAVTIATSDSATAYEALSEAFPPPHNISTVGTGAPDQAPTEWTIHVSDVTVTEVQDALQAAGVPVIGAVSE